MIRSLCLRQAQLTSLRSTVGLRPATHFPRCALPRAILPELSPRLVRRASSEPPHTSKPSSNPTQKTAAGSKTDKPKPTSHRLLVYHVGTPRIMFLGALKVTTALVFGFFTVVTIPSFVAVDAPVWQTAGLVVASMTPLLAIWYLTSPMVTWIHLTVPKRFKSPEDLARFINTVSGNTEAAITTVGPLGNARISKVTLAELRPEKRRFGLVNYVRDVARENAERKWYHFRAVGQFKIEDGVVDKSTRKPWRWYEIQETLTRSKAAKDANTVKHAHAPVLLRKVAAHTPPRTGRPPVPPYLRHKSPTLNALQSSHGPLIRRIPGLDRKALEIPEKAEKTLETPEKAKKALDVPARAQDTLPGKTFPSKTPSGKNLRGEKGKARLNPLSKTLRPVERETAKQLWGMKKERKQLTPKSWK